MVVTLPELSLTVLAGASGSGKSTFARNHFAPTEVLSSDACRAMLADDENDQSVTPDAFELLHYIAGKRLALGKPVVVDATNVRPEDRRALVRLAREYHVIPVAVVLDLPEDLCRERNRLRPGRQYPRHVVRNQVRQLRKSLKSIKKEGFRQVHVLRSPGEVDSVSFARQPMWTDRRAETGPFDIIGDIHGCFDETLSLLEKLGYRIAGDGNGAGPRYHATPPEGRIAVFVGDLVDRGPDSPGVLRLVMDMVDAGVAICVPGNHEVKLQKKLRGRDVKLSHGLAETIEQLGRESGEFKARVERFIDGLVSHYVLDGGRLVVAHAGMKEAYQGRGSGAVRAFALYGETTGETDEYGLPVRYDWAREYRGDAMVVYGHTPVAAAEWLNNTICIDTGCVFGGSLTALRYPERELVQVPAAREYYAPVRPLKPAESPGLGAQQEHDDMLDIADALGKRRIETRWGNAITITEDRALAALEVLGRFAVHPKWINYLPPTMSPPETSRSGNLLEHPAEAFQYFENRGVKKVICEAKHMGSRAIVQVCRDAEAARRRFGATGGEAGICHTRTGRRFFSDPSMEQALLHRLQVAIAEAGLWQELQTDWMTLDCELMPWSAKAMDLIRNQYAAVATAAGASLSASAAALDRARKRGIPVDGLLESVRERRKLASRYRAAYQGYCWSVDSVDNLALAPFHLLASEGTTHFRQDHRWHMAMASRIASSADPVCIATPHRTVDLSVARERRGAVSWWEELTGTGGEGMVVKPLEFPAGGANSSVQPALKCRGAEYLRIIYGPEYSLPANIDRLRNRGLGAKRRMALRQFRLGMEGLERFVEKAPLRRVHECVLGVLALEAEPTDPRL